MSRAHALAPTELERYRRILFDVDGTLLLGDLALPGAAAFVAHMRAAGASLCFGTNASFLTSETLVQRLRSAGIDARPGEAVTGIEVLANVVLAELGVSPLVSLAPPPVWRLLDQLGVQQLAPSALEVDGSALRAVLVAGFANATDRTALLAVARRVGPSTDVYVTNLDVGMVTATGIVPGPARTVETLCDASGIALTTIATGKPSRWFSDAAESTFAGGGPVLAVGDSPADVEGARLAGWDSLLVLSGATSAVSELAVAPTMVADSLEGLWPVGDR